MKNADIKKTINFLEELSWIFKTHKNLNFTEFIEQIKMNQENRNSIIHSSNIKNLSTEKSRLIGILPGLLNDKKLFNKNSDLVDFAESTFKINISRPEKRSRYEIIGLVIMELYSSKNSDLTEITDAIELLLTDNTMKTQLRNRKSSANFSWNDAIREITNQ